MHVYTYLAHKIIYLNMPVLALMKTITVMRWLDSITDSMDMNLSKLQESKESGVLQSMGSQS